VGQHQEDNVACAVAALHVLSERGFKSTETTLRRGLSDVVWPARLERIAGASKGPDVWLDAAHNPDGCAALAAHLETLKQRPRVLVFGAMQDKDVTSMLTLLQPVTEARVFTSVEMPRAMDPAQLAAQHDGDAQPSIALALRQAKKLAGKQGVVIVAGSIFVVADARAKLLKLDTDPLIRM
jgi:dihydrofolate synthase / folylpolyglutamate synthase